MNWMKQKRPAWRGLCLSLVGCEPAHLLLLVNTSGFSFQGLNRPKKSKSCMKEEEEGSEEDCERRDPGSKLVGESLEARLAGVAHL